MKNLLFRAFGRCLGLLGAASIAIMLLAGCASTTPRGRADVALAEQLGAPPQVAAKLANDRPLELADIVALKSLPDEVLIRHLKASGAIYTLTTAQVDQLRALGVSTAVVDTLLLSSSIGYPRVRYYGYFGYPHYYGRFGHGGYYGGHGFGNFGHHGGRRH